MSQKTLSVLCICIILVSEASSQKVSEYCRDANRLINTDKGDLYEIVDAIIGQKLMLQCHYCHENDDSEPKIWYRIDEFGSMPHEVEMDMNSQSEDNRVYENQEHSLIINFFNITDTGLYYCQRLEEENVDEKYSYLVDIVFDSDNSTTLETGNLTRWLQYSSEYLKPINALFETSMGSEYREVREILEIEMELMTEWRPWGICEVCGLPQSEWLRRKLGVCRIKLTHKSRMDKPRNSSNPNEVFIANANAVSCRSQTLARLFEGISNLTKIIPYFEQTEACEGTCNPDAEGVNQGWKTGKKKKFKYRKTFVLAQNAHLTIVCPESTMDNTVVWKKDGKVLTSGEAVIPEKPEEEPRIIVDTFSTLYLIDVKSSEAGNYTCEVDKVKMEQVLVFVISKSKILTEAFLRHMMYLSLVLMLTLPCYCAGIVIACRRKRHFKNYYQLKHPEMGPEAL